MLLDFILILRRSQLLEIILYMQKTCLGGFAARREREQAVSKHSPIIR